MMEDPTAAVQFGRGGDNDEDESEEESSIRKLIYLMQIELKTNVQYLLRWVQVFILHALAIIVHVHVSLC